MTESIKNLVSINGVSGNEKNVCEYIKSQILSYSDKVYTDVLGNLVAVKRGGGKRIMLMAHTDQIGIVCTFVDEKGFIRVSSVGGVDPHNFNNCHVAFENGIKGVFVCEKKDGKIQDCYVDIGSCSRDETLSKIDLGMTAKFDCGFYDNENVIVSGALDDRLGCYILMETLKKMKATDNEVYFVFSSQEEVGLRGAKVSGFDINPDIAIAVDVTIAADTPGCDDYGCKLGGGAGIKVRDSSAICNKALVDELENIAAERQIPYQRDVLTAGGTDIGAVQMCGRGVIVGGVSVAVRNVHTGAETAAKKDIRAAVELLCAYLEKEVENRQ